MPGTEKTVEQLQAELALAYASARELPEAVASPHAAAAPVDKYAATAEAWASNEFDFELPSGALCRMRKMPLKELAKAGILDQVTRLPGLVDGVIAEAEKTPPSRVDDMPDADTIDLMDDLLNRITPLVVVNPKVWTLPDPEAADPADREKVAGRIYPDSIDLADRIAIMERSMSGVKGLDNFRPQSD